MEPKRYKFVEDPRKCAKTGAFSTWPATCRMRIESGIATFAPNAYRAQTHTSVKCIGVQGTSSGGRVPCGFAQEPIPWVQCGVRGASGVQPRREHAAYRLEALCPHGQALHQTLRGRDQLAMPVGGGYQQQHVLSRQDGDYRFQEGRIRCPCCSGLHSVAAQTTRCRGAHHLQPIR